MNSYNNITKVVYTTNTTDVVRLVEYVIFEDTLAEEKYIVFKFCNTLNQKLKEIQFEINLFDKDNKLLGKSVISYDNFVAQENETFIPSAKLAVDFATCKVHAKLVHATFDNVVYENDAFKELEVAKKEEKPVTTKLVSGKKASKKSKKEMPTEIKKQKINTKKQKAYHIRNVYKKNKPGLPKFVNTLLIIIGIIASIALPGYMSVTNHYETDENYTYELSEALGTYEIVAYNGISPNITIPVTFNGKSVSGIKTGAFGMLSNVKTVTIESNITIFEGAFNRCMNLTEIKSENANVILKTKAIKNCKKLSVLYLPNSSLSNNVIDGCYKFEEIRYLNCNDTLASALSLTDYDLCKVNKVYSGEAYINNVNYFKNMQIEYLYASNVGAGALENVNYLNDTQVTHE